MSFKISAVIPTLHRPNDLKRAVVSILAQSRKPDELIIVDQSRDDSSKVLIGELFRGVESIRLNYIHDSKISGLIDAKRAAASLATSEIVCFLEDDIVLESEYFQEVITGFEEKVDMLGCSGVITNQPNQSFLYRTLRRLFFRGIFCDPRVDIFASFKSESHRLHQCDILSGGLSCWRREVLNTIPFDVLNGFHMFEDMEFSTRVVERYGSQLYVNRMARLEHHFSPINRDLDGRRQQRKMREAVLFYKKRIGWSGALSGFFCASVWWFAWAVIESVKNVSLGPLVGFFRGIADGVGQKLC